MTVMRLTGVGVSPGHAAGPVVVVVDATGEPDASPVPADVDDEAARIERAARAVAQALETVAARRADDADADPTAIEVLRMTATLAADPALVAGAQRLVRERSLPAPRAVFDAAAEFADSLAAAGGYLAERVRDVHDVRDRIVAELTGAPAPGVPELSRPSVLVARDLAPADTASLDPRRVLAVVTEEGGPTSHTAILARALGIPAVVACRGVLDLDADAVDVDGERGVVSALQGPAVTVRAVARTARSWDGTGVTADGHRIALHANVGSSAEAAAAAAAGAEGVGLFRTEFCYLNAAAEPSVDTQRTAYVEVLAPFTGKPVNVRTLDAGADKPLPFLRAEPQPNPALGVRGLRIAWRSPEPLRRQLAAIAAAAVDSAAHVGVMAPMVATARDAEWFVEVARSAGIERVGVMIEVPAAALAARELLDIVDFVSVGTNDLAQYTFAADRQIAAVASLTDPWQPALLRLVAMVGDAAAAASKPAGVCGEAAADPLLACVLAGLGVTSLSMSSAALDAVGGRISQVTIADCRRAAEAALSASDPVASRVAAGAVLSRTGPDEDCGS